MIDTAGSLQGFVWTQLTDIQQEINGLLFDRTPKLPLASINALMTIGSKEIAQVGLTGQLVVGNNRLDLITRSVAALP